MVRPRVAQISHGISHGTHDAPARVRFATEIGKQQQALATAERRDGVRSLRAAELRVGLGLLLLEHQPRAACAELESAVTVLSRELGPWHEATRLALRNAARALHRIGRVEESERQFRRLLEHTAGEASDRAPLAADLGSLLASLQRLDEALPLLREAFHRYVNAPERFSDNPAPCIATFAIVLKRLGHDQELAMMWSLANSAQHVEPARHATQGHGRSMLPCRAKSGQSTIMDRRTRHHALLALLAERPWPVDGLIERLRRLTGAAEGLSKRSVETDLLDLRQQLGDHVLLRMKREAVGEVPAHWSHHRVFWALAPGQEPVAVTGELTAISEDAVLAVELARAALRTPMPFPTVGPTTGDAELNPLAQALDLMLGQLGVITPARRGRQLSHRAMFSTFGSEGCSPVVMRTVLAVLRDRADLAMTYESIGKPPRPCTVKPIRLLYADHDWFLWAWEPTGQNGSEPKLWKLSRMSECHSATLRGAPPAFLEHQADAAERSMFRTTSRQRPVRIVAVFAPLAWPHARNRQWGERQLPPEPLPDGRWRLTFTTSGVDAARHWLLQFGAAVEVEQPPQVRAWLVEQAHAILTRYAHDAVVGSAKK